MMIDIDTIFFRLLANFCQFKFGFGFGFLLLGLFFTHFVSLDSLILWYVVASVMDLVLFYIMCA